MSDLPTPSGTADSGHRRGEVLATLDAIHDPCSIGLGQPIGLVGMGIIDRVAVDGGAVAVTVLPTFPDCLFRGVFEAEIETRLRALPWLGNVQVFAWRSDLVMARPNTWDEVVTTAQQIRSDHPETYGYAIRGAAGNPATTSYLPIIRGFGKDVLSPTFVPQLDLAY